jgi:hypothetical protein
MARRKKGGQRLIEMARKRRKSSSTPPLRKPKRLKGGQKLSALAGITPASRKRAAQKRKQARATAEDRPGGRFYKTPVKAKAKPKPKVRKYTTKESADYEKRYKETARKPDPAFAEAKPKSKATKKPVVTPPKGVKAATPGAGLTKRLTTIREKAASSKAARSRTARQTPKGAGRVLRTELLKEQKALVAEGKKIAKKFGLKIPAPSVKRAEQIGVPVELAGWVALAIAGRGKGKQMVSKKWSKLKSLFKGKPTSTPLTPPRVGHTPGTPLGGAGGHAAGAKATADAAKKAKRLRDAKQREKIRKAKQGASQWR